MCVVLVVGENDHGTVKTAFVFLPLSPSFPLVTIVVTFKIQMKKLSWLSRSDRVRPVQWFKRLLIVCC